MENVLAQGFFKNAGALVEWSLLENIDLIISTEQDIIDQRVEDLTYRFEEMVQECSDCYASKNTNLINYWMQQYHAFRDYCLQTMSEDQFCVLWNTTNHRLKNK